MNHKLIKVVISIPHAYPWSKENLNCSRSELNEFLNEYDLDTKVKRRAAGWKIKFLIFKAAISSNNTEKLVETVTNLLSNEKYCSSLVVRYFVNKFSLDKDSNILLLKKIFEKAEIEKNKETILTWLIELFTYYFCDNEEIGSKELQRLIVKQLNEYLSDSLDYNEVVKNYLFSSGLIKTDVVKLFSSTIQEYRNEVNELISGLILKKPSETEVINVSIEDSKDETSCDFSNADLSDTILSLFNNSTTLKLNEDEIKEAQEKNEMLNSISVNDELPVIEDETIEENKNETIDENKNEAVEKNEDEAVEKSEDGTVYFHLKSLSEGLGYQLATSDDVVLSKDKYLAMTHADKEKEVYLLKELASLKNGAILSELYNAYKNIHTISLENLEAVLTNFFFTLNVNGLEANEDCYKVGDIIEVDTRNVLKEFVFSESISKEGLIKAKVEHLGWTYKGVQIVPMIVKALE